MTYSDFPELPKDETDIQSSSGTCDKNLTEAAHFEPELDLTDGTQLELEIDGADARAVTEASQCLSRCSFLAMPSPTLGFSPALLRRRA